MTVTERLIGNVEEGREKLAELLHPRRRAYGLSALDMLVGAAIGSVATLVWQAWARERQRASGKTIGELMVTKVVSIPSAATLADAAQRMSDNNVGVLPVIEGEQVVGVITDRDIVVRGVARHANAGSAQVGQCATKVPVCARPHWTADEAMRVMSENQIGRLPVVDERDRLVGMVTLSSLALRSGEQSDALETAQQVSRRSARA